MWFHSHLVSAVYSPGVVPSSVIVERNPATRIQLSRISYAI